MKPNVASFMLLALVWSTPFEARAECVFCQKSPAEIAGSCLNFSLQVLTADLGAESKTDGREIDGRWLLVPQTISITERGTNYGHANLTARLTLAGDTTEVCDYGLMEGPSLQLLECTSEGAVHAPIFVTSAELSVEGAENLKQTVFTVQLSEASPCKPTDSPEGKLVLRPNSIPGVFDILFDDEMVRAEDLDNRVAELASEYGGEVLAIYRNSFRGFTIGGVDLEVATDLAALLDVRLVQETGYVRIASISSTNMVLNPATPNVTQDVKHLDRMDQAPKLSVYRDHYFKVPSHASRGQRVYVLDNGILSSHQEFFGNRVHQLIDTTGRQFAPCIQGASQHPHGTVVAALSAGNLVGLARDVEIYDVRVLGDNDGNCGYGTPQNFKEGLDAVFAHARMGDVVVAAVEFQLDDAAARTTIKSLTAKGVFVVVAAGNRQKNASNAFPANVSEAVTVGALSEADERLSVLPGEDCTDCGSNFGPAVDVMAPGDAMGPLTTGTYVYGYQQGTSIAAPLVAGELLLAMNVDPTLLPSKYAQHLTKTGAYVSATNLRGARPLRARAINWAFTSESAGSSLDISSNHPGFAGHSAFGLLVGGGGGGAASESRSIISISSNGTLGQQFPSVTSEACPVVDVRATSFGDGFGIAACRNSTNTTVYKVDKSNQILESLSLYPTLQPIDVSIGSGYAALLYWTSSGPSFAGVWTDGLQVHWSVPVSAPQGWNVLSATKIITKSSDLGLDTFYVAATASRPQGDSLVYLMKVIRQPGAFPGAPTFIPIYHFDPSLLCTYTGPDAYGLGAQVSAMTASEDGGNVYVAVGVQATDGWSGTCLPVTYSVVRSTANGVAWELPGAWINDLGLAWREVLAVGTQAGSGAAQAVVMSFDDELNGRYMINLERRLDQTGDMSVEGIYFDESDYKAYVGIRHTLSSGNPALEIRRLSL